MAKILQMHEDRHDKVLKMPLGCRDAEETASQIVALMQAKFSRPTPKEMLQILHCTEDQISAIRN